MLFKYAIEHMEDDDESSKAIPKWVELEYKHMEGLVGLSSKIYFTHVSSTSRAALETLFSEPSKQDKKVLAFTQSVLDVMKNEGLSLSRVCLLDPKAPQELSPEDGDGRFEWFLFGGILGDDPPRDRTSELRALGFPTRHLGPVQMTTDTAVGVTKIVVEDKVRLEDIKYIDYPTIRFNAKESVEMPFRYIAEEGEPRLPPGMRDHLHEDLNKSFDF